MKRVAILFQLIILSLGQPLQAQRILPDRPLLINVDYARFYYDQETTYLELYFAFHPKLLTYEVADGRYRAGLRLQTRILEPQTGKIIDEQRSSYTISEVDTNQAWYQYWMISQNSFLLPTGRYEVEVIATDSLTEVRSDTVKLPLEITSFGSGLSVSDLELCKNISRARGSQNRLFVKNHLEVVPNPTLIYGSASYPVMFCYLEMYNVPTNQPYKIRRQILDVNGKVIREVVRDKVFKNANVVDIGSMPVTSFPSGRYWFKVSLIDQNGEEQISSEKPFLILNPHLELRKEIAGAQIAAALKELNAEQLDQEFAWARYVATEEERNIYQQLTDVDGKREFLTRFWQSVARGRKDIPPISRDEYLRRVKLADERFGKFKKDGWATARGRVFLLYGEPDEIMRYPSQGGSKPYEIWYYFGIEKGVEFVFVDRSGYGDYELVHSTKRGELYDEDWMRFTR